MITEEYFKANVKPCKKCGSIPTLITETSIWSKTNEPKCRAVCWNCKWEDGEYGEKTGLCKTPETALKQWNSKHGKKED